MRTGGSKAKGNEFELVTCRRLSLWVSNGAERDLFARNVTSGGAFTFAAKRGKDEGVPGDIMGAHPLAHELLDTFFIECKSWKSLQLEAAMWSEKNEFFKVVVAAEKQSEASKKHYMLIVKQNYKPTLLLMPYRVGIQQCQNASIRYHSFWSDRVVMCLLEDMLQLKDPDAFIYRGKIEAKPWTTME